VKLRVEKKYHEEATQTDSFFDIEFLNEHFEVDHATALIASILVKGLNQIANEVSYTHEHRLKDYDQED